MAENDITFDLTDPNGTPAEQAVARIIAARTKELGETTENACVALAINVQILIVSRMLASSWLDGRTKV